MKFRFMNMKERELFDKIEIVEVENGRHPELLNAQTEANRCISDYVGFRVKATVTLQDVFRVVGKEKYPFCGRRH